MYECRPPSRPPQALSQIRCRLRLSQTLPAPCACAANCMYSSPLTHLDGTLRDLHPCWRNLYVLYRATSGASQFSSLPGAAGAGRRSSVVQTSAIAAPPRPSKTEQATPLQLGYTMPGARCPPGGLFVAVWRSCPAAHSPRPSSGHRGDGVPARCFLTRLDLDPTTPPLVVRDLRLQRAPLHSDSIGDSQRAPDNLSDGVHAQSAEPAQPLPSVSGKSKRIIAVRLRCCR